eukprot:GHUV01046951.1.p1 GENE.GHUV01046951.1~~GHUV01046951.1.p1  ORF type:complete len:138 (+),score=44.82 GHUV01046951.1:77-490(+)
MCMSRINRVQRAAGSHNSKPPCMQQQQQAGTKYCVMCVQVVMTTIEPKGGGKARSYDAFEYIAHSHTYMSDNQPTAKVTYDLSPIQVVVREQGKAWYHFLTTTCAIIGGVFTVAGILDSILYQGFKFARKVELGKQG